MSVQLKGEGTDQKSDLNDSSSDGFKRLKEGTYKLEFQKPGYKNRSKQVAVDCDLTDEKNVVWNFTYLWRDKKVPANDVDLVSDSNGTDSEIKTMPSSDSKIFGKVNINVVIDEDGNVISASRIDGDKRLLDRATILARRAKFTPTLIKGVPFQVMGSLTYNFVP